MVELTTKKFYVLCFIFVLIRKGEVNLFKIEPLCFYVQWMQHHTFTTENLSHEGTVASRELSRQ